ncbi:sugar-binding protein [Treponema sp. R80B11-R83G3]
MTKKFFKNIGIIFMAVMFIGGIALSCDNGTTTAAKSAEKTLTAITIKDKEPDKIPDPISQADLTDSNFSDPKYTGTVYMNDEASLATITVTVTVSAKATATFGLASGFDVPSEYSADTTLPRVSLGQALYVKVTAENGSVNYYRFSILLLSDNATLRTLVVEGVDAELGSPGTTWNAQGITNGTLALSNSLKTDAHVEGTPGFSRATVEYALMTTSGQPTGFSANSTYTFADGNTFWVKVTAENGQRFNFYKFSVQIGRDATLKSLTIGESAASRLGSSKTSWSTFTAAQRGACQTDELMPPEGFSITIESTDSEATVTWASIGMDEYTSNTPPTFEAHTAGELFNFPPDQSDVAVKVVSANTNVTRYYRIRIVTKSWAPVYKGTPSLVDPDDENNKQYIDPIWGDEEWLDISRVNTAEDYAGWFATEAGQHTTARAKALWDDDGLWVYWDVDFKDYNDGADKVRTASRSGAASTYSPGTDVTVSSNSVPSDAHTRDSVELFINERFQSYKVGNYGNQYRVGLPNATDGTIWLSGEKGNPPDNPYFNSITQFQIDKKVNVWIKMDGAKQTGYVVIMRAQWVKKYAAADINTVFDADGKVIDGANVGLELQVNACSSETVRDGILTWNGVTSQAYTQVRSFGIITLKVAKP